MRIHPVVGVGNARYVIITRVLENWSVSRSDPNQRKDAYTEAVAQSTKVVNDARSIRRIIDQFPDERCHDCAVSDARASMAPVVGAIATRPW